MTFMMILGRLPSQHIVLRCLNTSAKVANAAQQTLKTPHVQNNSLDNNDQKLIYKGALANRIFYLKTVSILSSLTLAGAYSYAISIKGYTTALTAIGVTFTPFFISPFVVAWFFKRYITALYYQPKDDLYTAYYYGLLLNKRSCTFRREDVTRSQVTSIMNTFKVGKKPFFLHDEDLINADSINIYRRMVGLDREKVE